MRLVCCVRVEHMASLSPSSVFTEVLPSVVAASLPPALMLATAVLPLCSACAVWLPLLPGCAWAK